MFFRHGQEMITGRCVKDKEGLELAGRLREEIFRGRYVTEVFPYPDAQYAVLWAEGLPVGMGGIRFVDCRFTLIEIGILEAYRLQMYGDFLLRLLADRGVDAHVKRIWADATEDSLDFFRASHFVPEGAMYESLGQMRTPMALELKELGCACSRDRFNPYRS